MLVFFDLLRLGTSRKCFERTAPKRLWSSHFIEFITGSGGDDESRDFIDIHFHSLAQLQVATNFEFLIDGKKEEEEIERNCDDGISKMNKNGPPSSDDFFFIVAEHF